MNNKPNPELIDDENPEWTAVMFSEAKTVAEWFPQLIKSGKSQKVNIAIDYDADIISAFRAAGNNWQGRINDALRKWLQEHTVWQDENIGVGGGLHPPFKQYNQQKKCVCDEGACNAPLRRVLWVSGGNLD